MTYTNSVTGVRCISILFELQSITPIIICKFILDIDHGSSSTAPLYTTRGSRDPMKTPLYPTETSPRRSPMQITGLGYAFTSRSLPSRSARKSTTSEVSSTARTPLKIDGLAFAFSSATLPKASANGHIGMNNMFQIFIR